MRMLRLLDRTVRRQTGALARRNKRVYTVLTIEEVARLDRLCKALGMNRSQATRFLLLKETAFALGRREAGVHRCAGDAGDANAR